MDNNEKEVTNMSWINIPDRFEYRVIEDLGKRNGRSVKIIRTPTYKTIGEAEKRRAILTPKENGILKIEKVFVE